MQIERLVVAIFAACAFVGWPILGQYSQANGGWVGAVVMGASATTVLLRAWLSGGLEKTPATRSLLLLAIAGIIHGAGICLYARTTTDPKVPTGAFVVLMSVLMAVVAPIFAWIFLKQVPTSRQYGGYVFAILAIYLLGK